MQLPGPLEKLKNDTNLGLDLSYDLGAAQPAKPRAALAATSVQAAARHQLCRRGQAKLISPETT